MGSSSQSLLACSRVSLGSLSLSVSTLQSRQAYWDQDSKVEQFASREPDHRLTKIAKTFANPSAVRILDLGCAGGRNTAYLLGEGFQVFATDFSEAMVIRTRERMTEWIGLEQARKQCWQAPMWDLSPVDTGTIDLIVGLGIYHNAGSKDEWDRTLAESARVLCRGGHVLMASFSPRMQMGEGALKPVAGEPHVFEGFDSGLSTLMSPADLDAAVAKVGWAPFEPTDLVEREIEGGRRSTVNALYVQR